jgi:hypothetical protein
MLSKHPTTGRPARRTRWWAVLIAPAAAALAMSVVPAAASHAATTVAGAMKAHAAPATALPVLTLKLTGTKVIVGGTRKSGAETVVTDVTYNNTNGGAQPVLVRLDPGVTDAQFLKTVPLAGKDPNNIYGIGQIAFSPQANKGFTSAQVSLQPGRYAALDVNAPGKTPPLTLFTVTKAAKPLPLPTPAATVSTIDFGFQNPATIKAGSLVRWQNKGFVVHMILGLQAKSLADASNIAKLLKEGKGNQVVPSGSYGWAGALSHGESFQSVVTQPAGFWVLVCFMDTQDGREHTTLGMEKVIQIVK